MTQHFENIQKQIWRKCDPIRLYEENLKNFKNDSDKKKETIHPPKRPYFKSQLLVLTSGRLGPNSPET